MTFIIEYTDIRNRTDLIRTLIYLYPNKLDYINNLIYVINCYDYIIITDDEIEISNKYSRHQNKLYLSDNEFINIINILRQCNINTTIVKIFNKNEYNYMINNYIHFSYIIFNECYYSKFLILINNNIHIIPKEIYKIFFKKYKSIDINLFNRIMKLKQLI